MRRIQLNCKNVYHNNQPIVGVCVDQECQKEKPFCQECQQSHAHIETKLLSFEQLRKWFVQFFSKFEQTVKSLQYCSIQIEHLFNKLDRLRMTQLNHFAKEMIILEKLLEMLQPSLNQSREQLDQIHEQYNSVQQNDSITQLENQLFQESNKKVRLSPPQLVGNLNIGKQTPRQIPKQFEIVFTNEQLNQDIKIASNGKQVSCLKSSNFVIGQPMIPKTGITKFAIKLLNPVSYVALGVGDKQILNQNHYNVDPYNQTKHGTYLINSHGIAFSHSQKNEHSNVSFNVNDTIIIELNMQNSKITWTKLADNNNQQYSLTFNKNLDLYPLLNLNLTAVQVVDNL